MQHNRPEELRNEVDHLLAAASFLIVSARRKIDLAEQLERLSRADRLGGGRNARPAPARSIRGDGC